MKGVNNSGPQKGCNDFNAPRPPRHLRAPKALARRFDRAPSQMFPPEPTQKSAARVSQHIERIASRKLPES